MPIEMRTDDLDRMALDFTNISKTANPADLFSPDASGMSTVVGVMLSTLKAKALKTMEGGSIY